MMSLWDALRMNMMISYQELVRTFLSKFPTSLAPILESPILLTAIIATALNLLFNGTGSEVKKQNTTTNKEVIAQESN
jgi:NCS2 family nucleobase:cation symporter-2